MASFLDTNILIYAVGLETANARKIEIANALLDGGACVLSVQTLQEFFAQATRPSRKTPLPAKDAADFVVGWTRFTIIENTTAVLQHALALTLQHRFSLWDASIIAAAIAGGCDVLYTEDMQHGREVEGVRIVNPFLGA